MAEDTIKTDNDSMRMMIINDKRGDLLWGGV